MAAVELATAYVTLAVESSEIARAIGQGFQGGDKIASRSGRSMGRSMGKAFTATKPLDAERATEKLQAAQDRLARHTERSAAKQRNAQQGVADAREKVASVAEKSSEKVQSAQTKVENAEADLARTTEQSSRDQESAKRRVELAQERYTEAVAKHGPESTQAMAASNRLADAEDRLAKTVEDGSAKQERAKQKVTDAQDDYAKAVKESGEDSAAARKAADDLSVAEQKLEAAALEAASGHEKLSAEVDEAKRALDEAQRSSEGLRGAWGKVKDFGADYKGMGERLNRAIGPKIWKGVKWGALGAATAIGGTLVASLKKGWDRLTGIENAEAKLTGLGHSAEGVSMIMDDALASVKGTAFGMDEAATTAASAVAAGIEPGKELESYLGLVGDAASIAGTSMSEMGGIFNKVATSGKVQGDVFRQLGDAGIPIVQLLADEMGTTADEVYALGSAGEISSEKFLDAMSSMEGAALESGNTTSGAIKNTGAAMGRFGAALLQGVYPAVAPLMGRITDLFDYLTDKAGPIVEGLTEDFQEWANSPQVQAFLEGVRDVAVALYENALKPLGEWIGKYWKPIAAAIGGLVAYLGGAMLVAALVALKTALLSITIPVTAVGAAIAAVAGTLVYFFTQTEVGQKVVAKAWDGIKSAVSGVADYFVNTVWPALLTGWDLLQTVVMAVWNDVLSPIFTSLADLALQVWHGVIIPAFEQFVDFVQGTVMPIVQQLWTDYIQPAFLAIGALAVWLWHNAIKPAVSAIASFWSDVLGPVIVWFWQKIVLPVFGLIGDFIAGVVTGVIFPILDGLGWVFTNVIGPVVMWLWRKVFQPAWAGIKIAVAETASWVMDTAVPWLQQAWDSISSAATWLYENVIQPVWTGIRIAIAIAATAILAAMDLLVWTWQTVVAPMLRWLNEKVVQPVWSAIKSAIDAVVKWFRDVAWPIASAVIQLLRVHFNALRVRLAEIWGAIQNRVIQPVVTWLRDTAWAGIIKPTLDKIKSAFNTMRDALKRAWDYVKDKAIKPVVDWFDNTVRPKVTTFTDKVKEAFDTLKDNVLAAWDGIKTGLKKPINGVIEIYNEHIAGNFNKVADTLKLDDKYHLEPMDKMATGGILPGRSSWRDGDDQIIQARRGEGILVSEGLRDRESQSAFLDANHAARTRGVSFADYVRGAAGYAKGGLVKLRMPFNGSYPRGDGFGARGGRHKGVDWPMPHGASLVAVAPGTANRTRNAAAGNKLELRLGNGLVAGYHHLSRFGIGQGAQASAGQTIGYVGSTGRSSGPHLHFSLKKNGTYVNPMPYLGAGGAAGDGDDGGSWWNPFSGLWGTIKDAVAEKVGDNPVGGIVSKVTENTITGVGDWVTGKLAEFGDWAVETGKEVAGTAGVTARWGLLGTRALTMTGDYGPLVHTSMMRRINQESGGDKNAINTWDSNARRGTPSKGLMQVIQPTFNAHRDSRAPNNIWDPLANMLASIHYTKSRYGSLRKGWDRPGGYAMGGIVGAPFLHDSGGWHDPGQLSLNLTRKPEAVLTDAQWDTMHSLAGQNLASEGGSPIYIEHAGLSPEDVVDEMDKRKRERAALRVRVRA